MRSNARSQLGISRCETLFESRADVRRLDCALKIENHFGKRPGSEAIKSGNSGPDVNPRPRARPHAALTKSGHSSVSGTER